MNHPVIHLAGIIAGCAFLGGLPACSSYSQVTMRSPRYEADEAASADARHTASIIRDAGRAARREPLQALAGYLHAAKRSLQAFQQDPGHPTARTDYNFAVARIISTLRDAKLEPWAHALEIPTDGGTMVLAAGSWHRANWNPALYDFLAADEIDIRGRYVRDRTVREGLGAPLVACGRNHNAESLQNFAMQRIYYGVTAIARFDGNRCEIGFEDPLANETIAIGRQRHPLAADFTAPLAVMLAANDTKKLELMRVLRPAEYAESARLVSIQPYDPDKTVVLVIHGLKDSQATWTPMVNTLRGDPEIRKNCQFWFYSYPSGYPYPYSAAILRRNLDAAGKRYPVKKPMVVVGHSMGGCISRLLITDSGDKLWNAIFNKPPAETRLSPENKRLFLDSLVFRHRPEIGRVIFIAAPLRGSRLADHWVGRFASRLVEAPATLLNAGREASALLAYQTGDLSIKQMPNSIDTLSPDNRFVRAVNSIPITPGIPYHTIIGDRGKGDSPDSSDGVVPYWSSHMPGAASERVVPSDHSAHQHPEAIEEVRKILRSHIR